MTIEQITYIIVSLIFGYNMALDSLREEWNKEGHGKKGELHICLIYLAKFIVNFTLWPIYVIRLIWNKFTK